MIELHVITVCMLVLAAKSLAPQAKQLRNWLHRQRIHRAHLRDLERQNG